jgi:hypothetical protein
MNFSRDTWKANGYQAGYQKGHHDGVRKCREIAELGLTYADGLGNQIGASTLRQMISQIDTLLQPPAV